jgi:hypothetical protein
MEKPSASQGQPASELISKRTAELGDWRRETLGRMRELIRQADPDVVEEWKWMGTPVWSHDGIICTGESYKSVVKFTFAKGASLKDPARLFNSSLEGNRRRAIDIREGEKVDDAAFQMLIREAIALNSSGKSKSSAAAKPKEAANTGKRSAAAKGKDSMAAAKPALLAGGNPRIAKGDGDISVQAYITAMPGWKRDVGRRLDALITRTVPDMRKAVKWTSPFYGIGGQGWFLSFHCYTKYVKVAFFRGASLRPLPPSESKQKEVRYLDILEHDPFDEELLASWIRQASELPGWVP